jgi:hypothetical protein
MEQKTGCLFCGEELVYTEKSVKEQCFICKKEYETNTKCMNNHFICDGCHSLEALDFIENYCLNNNESINPFEQAFTLMHSSKIKANGPEHHFLVAAVLVNSFYNAKKNFDIKKEKLEIVKTRAGSIPGGYCGFYGNCGAGVANGIFISVITGATPLSKDEWKLANLITGMSLTSIAESGGPRCCKRDSFIAMTEAINFVNKHFRVNMEKPEKLVCEFSKYNKECTTKNCKFFDI